MKKREKALRILFNTFRSLAVGIVTGACITLFANTVNIAGVVNHRFPLLILLIPLGAYLTLAIYQKLGDSFRKTTVEAIDTIHEMEDDANEGKLRPGHISPWMGPVAYIAAAISHITGASVGKEGVGVQIGLAIGELFTKIERKYAWKGHYGREDYYLMTGSAAAFGSLFGAPIAGVLFGLMFATPDILRLDALFPVLVSAYSAVYVALKLGIHKMEIPSFEELPATVENLITVAVFALIIGLLARVFLYLLARFRKGVEDRFGSKILSAIIPGTMVTLFSIIIFLLSGSFDYNGLSLDLLYRAIDGRGIPLYTFILKALMVFLSIAAGFVGGEVVPLLVTGGTFGYSFAAVLGLETAPFAVLGAVGMLTGGTNLPLVCFALAIELFGYSEPGLLFMTVALSYLASGDKGIYHHQRIAMKKRTSRD